MMEVFFTWRVAGPTDFWRYTEVKPVHSVKTSNSNAADSFRALVGSTEFLIVDSYFRLFFNPIEEMFRLLL